MKDILILSAIISVVLLIYIYIGYPLLLFLLSPFYSKKRNRSSIRPTVSMIISCYNEERVIKGKLLNTLSLNYPEGRLEIIVASDASDDRTDEIAAGFADQGVRLVRQQERLGKTCGLNLALSQAEGEIIIFSDANAIYDKDAVIRLVENFSDEKTGYVVGRAKYIDFKDNASAKSENTYWNYEAFIKKLESGIHSVVGGDGAIYAIRRELYEDLKPSDISDFVNPLQIILKGYRGIYEPEAVCTENTAGSFESEFRRKVRIVNRSFKGILRVKSVLNPFKTGIFSFMVFSHKFLRWFAPFIILFFGVSSLVLSLFNMPVFHWINLCSLLFLLCAYTGFLLSSYENPLPFFYYPYYFVAVNIASMIGIFKTLRGEVKVTWTPTRGKAAFCSEDKKKWAKWLHLSAFFAVLLLIFNMERLSGSELLSARLFFWVSFLSLLYTYFGYPAVLFLWSGLKHRPIQKKDIVPEVAMLICAYNEEEVIEEKIKSSFELDYPPEKLKIIIASDGSDDKTCEIVRRFSNKNLILFDYPDRSGKIGAINRTVPEIKSEIIVFSDANTLYDRAAVRKLVRNFHDPSVGGVSADVVLKNKDAVFGRGETLYYRYERWIQEKESKISSIIGADGGMYAIRRELFEAPSSNIILDDFVISMNIARRGYRLVYEKDALGYEENTISQETEFLRKSRVMAGAVQALKQAEGIPSLRHGGLFFCFFSHKFLRWTVPVFLIILLGLNIILAACMENNAYLYLLIMQIIFYFFALLGFFIQNEIKSPMILIPYYFCLENGALLYGLYKGIFDKQSVKWRKFSRKKAS